MAKAIKNPALENGRGPDNCLASFSAALGEKLLGGSKNRGNSNVNM
jgi:hypothetical protein